LAPHTQEGLEAAQHLKEVLQAERIHEGVAAEALILACMQHAVSIPAGTLSESDQRLLNSILMREDEPLTTELIRGAVDALRRRKLERHQREIRSRIAEAEKRQELQGLPALLQEKVRIDRQLAGIG